MYNVAIFKKKLTVSMLKRSGRNNSGRITSHHRSGGVMRRFRRVDFFRPFDGMPALVRAFDVDPNRSAKIAIICYYNEVLSIIIANKGLKIGSVVASDEHGINSVGNFFCLKNLPSGLIISSLELWPSSGGKYARAKGVSAQLLKQFDKNYAIVRLNTGEQRLLLSTSRATIGVPSGPDFNFARHVIGKAGRNRNRGHRPIVRGVAMNPVDHPHGGAGGRVDRSPWGWITKGPRTTRQQMLKYIQHKRKRNTKYLNYV
jgi:large subunit ribosomal protein L2